MALLLCAAFMLNQEEVTAFRYNNKLNLIGLEYCQQGNLKLKPASDAAGFFNIMDNDISDVF